MPLSLVTSNGEQVAPAWVGPRFVARGGDLIDFAQQHAAPTLRDAQLALQGYEAMLNDQAWDTRVRANLMRERQSLREAIAALCEQRRAAGFDDPHGADARRGEVA